MIKFLKAAIYSMLLLVFVSCEKEKDKYYERPEWLRGPIYQQLVSDPQFKIFKSCIDQTPYKDILGRTGYFTVFAPNDEAFKKLFAERNISTIDGLDTGEIRAIVNYAIVDNGYNRQQLAAWQSAGGWIYNYAFKRKTRYSNYLYTDSASSLPVVHSIGKYIPYFIDEYMKGQQLTATSYNTFYPGIIYTGFHIANATVIGKEKISDNGYLYELDQVVVPLKNIDEHLINGKNHENYSLYRNILNKFATFKPNTTLTNCTKTYTTASKLPKIVFSPNEENWPTSTESNNAQYNGNTVFAPNNAAVQKFMDEKMLLYYPNIDSVFVKKPEMLIDFINMHLHNNAIWPEQYDKYATLKNITSFSSNVKEAIMASNGFFYGLDKVLETNNSFYSNYCELYINPDYSMMYKAIFLFDPTLKNLISSKDYINTILLANDDAFTAAGMGFDAVKGQFIELAAPTIKADDKAKRMVQNLIIKGEFSDFSGSGFVKTYSGDYIQYSNNKLKGADNSDANAATPSEKTNKYNNGTLLKIDKIIIPPQRKFYAILSDTINNPQYFKFFKYLSKSTLLMDGAFSDITTNQTFTVFVPSNDAIAAAGLPSDTSNKKEDKLIVEKFLRLHVIPNISIFTDGNTNASLPTIYQSGTDGRLKIFANQIFSSTFGNLTITDKNGVTANVIVPKSNIQSADFGVIHLIDKVLTY